MTICSPTNPPLFAPTITRTETGYGLALNMAHAPFLEFTTRGEAFDALCLFEDAYKLGTTPAGKHLVQVLVPGHTVANEQEFTTVSAALTFIEDDFEEEYTRPLVRYALTDEALAALADFN